MEKPYKIQAHLQEKIDNAVNFLLHNTPYDEFRDEVYGFIADVKSGRAYYPDFVFTVPLWASKPDYPKNVRSSGGYFIYYVAHELSHLIAIKVYGGKCYHDSNFYEVFKRICPKEYQYFELRYKKNAPIDD